MDNIYDKDNERKVLFYFVCWLGNMSKLSLKPLREISRFLVMSKDSLRPSTDEASCYRRLITVDNSIKSTTVQCWEMRFHKRKV